MARNLKFLICPSLALFRQWCRQAFHASKHCNTHEGIMSLFELASALIGGIFFFLRIGRMFTKQLNIERAHFISFFKSNAVVRYFYL